VEAIFLDQTSEPFVCLHCGKCVPFCPHDCLAMKELPVAAGAEQEVAS
jgi:formate hydrogenlyase subunit 6/NADH:ubiquinone oxidoreductase subunit I